MSRPLACWAIVVFAGIAPDLDFLAGLIVGDVNELHQGASHSILFALAAGVLAGLVTKAARVGVLVALSYGSHLVLDMLTFDGRAPYGIPLLWPFSGETWQLPWLVFDGIRHGVPGDGLPTVLGEIFSLANGMAVAKELLLLLPVWWLGWRIGRSRNDRRVL